MRHLGLSNRLSPKCLFIFLERFGFLGDDGLKGVVGLPTFRETKAAGTRFESACRDVFSRYTRHIKWSTKVDTAYTQSGVTEIDLLVAIADVLLIVESKNIRSIKGGLTDSQWVLEGAESGEKYTALNIFTQNRIHARSLKNAWFQKRAELLVTLPLIIVPDECSMEADVEQAGIFYFSQLDSQLRDIVADWGNKPARYGYALDYLIPSDDYYLKRGDFVDPVRRG